MVRLRIITRLLIGKEWKQSEDKIVIVSTPFPHRQPKSLPLYNNVRTLGCICQNNVFVYFFHFHLPKQLYTYLGDWVIHDYAIHSDGHSNARIPCQITSNILTLES